jgi:hypothetical protein
MGQIALFYRVPATKIDTVELDASLSETHARSADATKHPVEKGAKFTDHVQVNPDGLVIEGIVSNTPLSTEQINRYVQAGGLELETSAFDDAPRGVPGYAEAAFEKLRALVGSEVPITVVTTMRDYENMVLTSLSVPRDASTGDALRFTATFEQIIVVSNKLTTVETRVPGAKKKQKRGPQTGTEKKPEEYSSALSKMTGIGEIAESF